jgi:HPt (histidine-containing phosphotransfer) domain-containing protein
MVDHELDELKREFLAEADEKVREIETGLAGERTPEAVERLTYLAHQLKGSGGSYGYQQISADAAELEKAFELMASGDGASALDARVDEHVKNLRSEIGQRLQELAAV